MRIECHRSHATISVNISNVVHTCHCKSNNPCRSGNPWNLMFLEKSIFRFFENSSWNKDIWWHIGATIETGNLTKMIGKWGKVQICPDIIHLFALQSLWCIYWNSEFHKNIILTSSNWEKHLTFSHNFGYIISCNNNTIGQIF